MHSSAAERVLWAALALAALLLLAVAWAALAPRPAAEALRYFTPEHVARARAYVTPAYLSFAASRAAQLALLAYLALTPAGRRWVTAWSARAGDRPVAGVVAAALAVLLALVLVRLPFAYFRGFVHEHRFGLSNQSLATWAADLVKGSAIDLAVTLLAVAVLAALARALPALWWLPAAAALALGMTLLTMISPLVIDPLFYRFQPLADEALRARLVEMAGRAGLEVDEVLVADASRRTNRVNAYFTGVGPTRRIVLYDNLLRTHPPDEVEVVVAHELGHWAKGHIRRGLWLGAAAAFAGLFVLHRLLRALAADHGWAWPDPRLVAPALLAFMLAGLLLLPVQNAVSRAWEREADAVSLELSRQPEAAARLARRLAEANLSDPQPHPLHVVVLFTHPPQLERIRTAERWGR